MTAAREPGTGTGKLAGGTTVCRITVAGTVPACTVAIAWSRDVDHSWTEHRACCAVEGGLASITIATRPEATVVGGIAEASADGGIASTVTMAVVTCRVATAEGFFPRKVRKTCCRVSLLIGYIGTFIDEKDWYTV